MNDKTKTFEHPLEVVFDIEPNTTAISRQLPTVVEHKDLVIPEEYDNKDQEVEKLFDDVYEKAMKAFEDQQAMLDIIPLTAAARNGEVSVQFLNSALAAAKEKANLKQHKDKIVLKQKENAGGKGPKTVNNNIVIDTNELLRLALQGASKDITPANDQPKEKRKIKKTLESED